MNVNDLKIGDIIITDVNEVDGDQYPKIIVVGSAPVIVAGQSVSFNPVLKRNRREDYYVAANTSRIDLNGENLDGVVAVLSTMEDAFNFNVSDQFDVEADDEWVDKVNKKIAIAFKKRNWILTPVNNIVEEVPFDEEAPVEDNFATSHFFIEVDHRRDYDVRDILDDVLSETDDDDIVNYRIVNLN